MNERRNRPTWSSLEAFVAAARRESFRDAARDLGVTTSAISHQIRAMESSIGAALFERGVRQVRLTAAGRNLGRAIGEAFDSIDRAVDAARSASARKELRIAALPLIASVWLGPRLAAFEARYPELSLSIDTGARIADLDRKEADVAIRNVPAPTSGLIGRKLLDLRATPLCAPALARNLKGPRDLADATLIGLSVGRAGWPDWFAAVGAPAVKPKKTLRFDAFPDAIEAAAKGRGVLLGLLPLVFLSPAAGELVAPFDLPPQDAGSYFVVRRKSDAADATVTAFVEWIAAEMRADLRRLRATERARLRVR